MHTDKIIKIALFNMAIAITDTALFSPGLVGLLTAHTEAIYVALGGTSIFASVATFIYGNYKLISQKALPLPVLALESSADYIHALSTHGDKKAFREDISIIKEQIQRIEKKKETIRDILLQKFDSGEMSFKKFDVSVNEVQKVFFLNIKSILNKINAFDEDDFERIKQKGLQGKFSQEVINTKLEIYNEYIEFVKNAVEDNEEILLKLDRLLLEISKFNSLDQGQIENMDALKEIDELTKQAKFYTE